MGIASFVDTTMLLAGNVQDASTTRMDLNIGNRKKKEIENNVI